MSNHQESSGSVEDRHRRLKRHDFSKLCTTGGNPKAPPFRREQVGQVRIVDVFDDHYAHAAVVTGQAQVGDMAVLDN